MPVLSPPPLIHIGYHKTATTWMQRQLFTPEHGYVQIAGHEEVSTHVVGPHGLSFSPKPMKMLISEKSKMALNGQVAVISSEILSGNLFYGGRESDIFAQRLKAIAPEARILISIRSQKHILTSVYMQYLIRGGTLPPKKFFCETTEFGYFGFASAHFEFDRLISHYQLLFGRENVYILTQESLKKDIDGTLMSLARFCENTQFAKLSETARQPHVPSYPEHAAPILRRINHIQTGTLNPNPIISFGHTPRGLYKSFGYISKHFPYASFMGSYRPVSDYVQKTFAGTYSASNARLATLTANPLDLSGYDLPPNL